VGTTRTRRGSLAIATTPGLVAVLACAVLLPQASAAFPGKNGRIVYANNAGTCCGDIHLVKPSGAGDRNITNTAAPVGEYQTSFSPNGRKIAFQRDNDIWVISTKGKGLKQLTTTGDVAEPAFSPNGRKIVFARSASVDLALARRRGGGQGAIWIMRKDGTHQRQLTSASGNDTAPSFAANGKLIAFESRRDGDAEIFTMRANGERERQLTHNDLADYTPSFSPNSKRIVFARNGPPGGLYSFKKSGAGERRLTTHPTADANTTQIGSPTFSPNGKRIAYRYYGAPNNRLITIDKLGGDEQIVVDAVDGDVQSPDWGPKPPKKKRRHRR
jgi:TolB protein